MSGRAAISLTTGEADRPGAVGQAGHGQALGGVAGAAGYPGAGLAVGLVAADRWA